jgi:hypothetical protein
MRKFNFVIALFLFPFLSSHAQITISPTNLVGIGNANPQYPLDVIGEINSSGGTFAGYSFWDRTITSLNWSIYSTGGTASIWNNSGIGNILNISQTGNVGIGYTNNTINGITYQLAVNG